MGKPVFLVSVLVRHKPTVQLQKMARCLKLGSRRYDLCSENNGADQLHGYRTPDLFFA